jgi:hypothetical protein
MKRRFDVVDDERPSKQRRPIPLYPHPPDSPAQDELSGEISDFPPIRIRDSTPDPPIHSTTSRLRSSAVQKDSGSARRSSSVLQQRRPGLPNKGLGHKNIINTVIRRTPHAQVINQFFLKMILLIE